MTRKECRPNNEKPNTEPESAFENHQPDSGQTSDKKTSSPPRSLKNRILWEVLDWIRIFAIAGLIAWICNSFFIINTQVPTGSMEDTIPKPSRVLSSRMHYWFSDPQHGDVVLFDPPDGDEYYYVKRVIGLPGDTILIADGKVYINGSDEPLDEPYLKETPIGDFGPYEVPEGCYFVMGDNRNHSNDSRYWINTYVPRENIYAKAIFVYWPRLSIIR